MEYNAPFGVADTDAPYVNGDPSQGLKGSIPPAESIEYDQREIVHLIDKGGFVPDNDDLYQLIRGVRGAKFSFATDTGSANSLSIALDPPIAEYAQGLEVHVLVANDNTAPATIRVNGLSTQQILRKDGSALIPGDLRLGGLAILMYDGANFQLVSGAAGSTTITGGWFNGADWIVDGGTANHITGGPPILPTAYAAGQGYAVLVNNRNTGAVDINVTGTTGALGVKNIKMPTGQDLQAGDIVPGMVIYIRFDGTNFVMLSPIDMAIIQTALTKIVGPNAGADFSDLIVAMAWADRRRFAQSGSIQFALQAAPTAIVHNYSAPIVINHPQGDKITIYGGPMDATITGSSFQCTHYNNNASDFAVNLAMLRNAFESEIRCTVAAGIRVSPDCAVTLRNVLLTGPGYGGGGTGIALSGNAAMTIDTVASAGFGTTWSIDSGAQVSGRCFYSCGSGFYVAIAHHGGVSISDHFVIAQHGVDGVQMAHDGQLHIGPMAGSDFPFFYGCLNCGINHWGHSSVWAPAAHFYMCAQQGIKTVGANSYVAGGNASYCSQGYLVSIGQMDCSTCVTGAITAGDYTASNGAYMYAAAFQNPSAQFSPARNTVGNGNAFIGA